MLKELGFEQPGPAALHCDNQSARERLFVCHAPVSFLDSLLQARPWKGRV